MTDLQARIIAFYLPQYHPIPENDEWWGKGFTEWTNVTKAKPLYKGHEQPKLAAELGYYDLRLPDTRKAQADLAKEYGITAFCYWHYWFGHGKRILNRVFDEVVASGQPDFPFCLAWANQSWTGHWHGNEKTMLIEQQYGGEKDHEKHFYTLLDAFKDDRYLKINGQPIFLIYNPWDLPNPIDFTNLWNRLANENGIPGMYFIAIDHDPKRLSQYGMNGSTWHEPVSHQAIKQNLLNKVLRKLGYKEHPKRFEYSDVIQASLNTDLMKNQFPMVVPNWDNTPRAGRNGLVYEGATPELFKKHLKKAVSKVQTRPPDEQLIFIKSWNEWAEGNYLEPDQKWGRAYLEAIKEVLTNPDK